MLADFLPETVDSIALGSRNLKKTSVECWGRIVGDRQMARYFFDLIGHHRSLFDFQGHTFSDRYKAHEQAQLLALDLQVEEDEEFMGGRVDVCDVRGGVMFSVTVPEQLAA
jgi:hypothetical protein